MYLFSFLCDIGAYVTCLVKRYLLAIVNYRIYLLYWVTRIKPLVYQGEIGTKIVLEEQQL